MLEKNVESIIMSKITGIKEIKKNIYLSLYNHIDGRGYRYFNFKSCDDSYFETLKDVSYAEIEAFCNMHMLYYTSLDWLKIKAYRTWRKAADKCGKMFDVTVRKMDWDSMNKDNDETEMLKIHLKEKQQGAIEFLSLSDEDKVKEFPNKTTRDFYIKFYNAMLKISYESIKAMYELVKGTDAIIWIELPSEYF